MTWTELDNGVLHKAAEAHFNALITTDRNLRYQQNLAGRRLAILVLPTTELAENSRSPQEHVVAAVNALRARRCRELNFS